MSGRTLIACAAFAFSLVSIGSAQAQQTLGESHIAVQNPAELSKDEANAIYDKLKEMMASGYGISQMALVENYQSWARYNSAPYLSATHGQRFVNNYANEAGKAYGSLKEGEKLPQGTVLAKDSITVKDDGKFYPGALFLMEKLGAGASPETADWRYVVINPDGSLAGDTTGDGPELVKYCHDCHVGVAEMDYIFYVPEDYRTAR